MRVRQILHRFRGNATIPSDLAALFSVLWIGNISGNYLVDTISGNNILVTNKDFSTTTIPESSTATFSLPNTSSLKTDDDFDNAWYDSSGTIKQQTVTNLLGRDYSRTLVKYANSSPYDIEWIGVLKSSATPTSDQWNRLHTYFRLHVYWSGMFNDYGYLKDNIALDGRGYKAWIGAITYNSYTAPASGVLSSVNKFIFDLMDYGVWTGFDGIWNFMLNDGTLIDTCGALNLAVPGSYQFTFPIAPTYTTSGIKGNGSTQYGDSNYNPTSNGVNYTLNDGARGIYVYSAGTVTDYYEGHSGSGNDILTNTTGSGLHRINGGSMGSAVNSTGTGYRAINRSASNAVQYYKDLTQTTDTAASSALANQTFTLLRSAFGYGAAGLSLYFIGRSFTQTEHANIRTAFLAHKTRLGL